MIRLITKINIRSIISKSTKIVQKKRRFLHLNTSFRKKNIIPSHKFHLEKYSFNSTLHFIVPSFILKNNLSNRSNMFSRPFSTEKLKPETKINEGELLEHEIQKLIHENNILKEEILKLKKLLEKYDIDCTTKESLSEKDKIITPPQEFFDPKNIIGGVCFLFLGGMIFVLGNAIIMH